MENKTGNKVIVYIIFWLLNLMFLGAYLATLIQGNGPGEFIGTCILIAVPFIFISAVRAFTYPCLLSFQVLALFGTAIFCGDSLAAVILCYFEFFYFTVQQVLYLIVRPIRFGIPLISNTDEDHTEHHINNADEKAIENKMQTCIGAIAHKEPEILADQFCRQLKNDIGNTLFGQIQSAFDLLGSETIEIDKDKTAGSKFGFPGEDMPVLYLCDRVYSAKTANSKTFRITVRLHYIWEKHDELVGVGYVLIKDMDTAQEHLIGRTDHPYYDR